MHNSINHIDFFEHIILLFSLLVMLHIRPKFVLHEAQSCKRVVQISHAETNMNIWTYLNSNYEIHNVPKICPLSGSIGNRP